MSDVAPEPATDNAPPPSGIAGVDAVAAEPTGEETGDDRPELVVRDVVWHVQPVPAILVERLLMVQRDLPKVAKDTLFTDLPVATQKRFSAVRAVSYELLMNSIVEDERYEFERFCVESTPTIDATELAEIMQRALVAASGRPTEPS